MRCFALTHGLSWSPSPILCPKRRRLDIAGYDNVEAILDAVQPQGVINATPNLLHVPCALAIPQMQCWRYAKRAAGQAA